MMNNKYDAMIETLLNGNISDFNEKVRKLKKLELIELVRIAQSWNSITDENIIQAIKRALR